MCVIAHGRQCIICRETRFWFGKSGDSDNRKPDNRGSTVLLFLLLSNNFLVKLLLTQCLKITFF